ncbi:GNAT family N-acetyltransferase [Candidatus Kaiserbacteria bacterium]|nr:GNAT family N-acetyltransferase [Candidatus Kaiserbacteria bacterium]
MLFSRLPHCSLRAKIGLAMTQVARSPEAGSEFDTLTQHLRHLPDDELLSMLTGIGYDCVIALEHGRIIGYLAHQRRERETHCFSLCSMQGFGGRGLATRMTEFWLRCAKYRNVERARLWAGDRLGNLRDAEQMRRIYRRMVENRGNLSFPVVEHACGEPGWIHLAHAA